MSAIKVTTVQADAADETAVKNICEQALKDEGRLDVFFANVSRVPLPMQAPCIMVLFTGRQALLASPH